MTDNIAEFPPTPEEESIARKLEEIAAGIRDGSGQGRYGMLILSIDVDGDGTTQVFHPQKAGFNSMSMVGLMEDLKFTLLSERNNGG